MSKKQWPGISISEEDSDLVSRIIKQDGILRNIDQKDLLMLAAALAVKNNAPQVITGSGKKNVAHPDLINGDRYNEFRQYISMIFFQTAGKKDLKSMDNPKVMMDNFVDYASRGLHLLKAQYLELKESDEKLLEDFVGLLESSKES